jgi:hypothetical protein
VKAKKTLPAGFVCPCGLKHQFPAYVYAHWDVTLHHKCEGCGSASVILRGRACQEGRVLKTIPSKRGHKL